MSIWSLAVSGLALQIDGDGSPCSPLAADSIECFKYNPRQQRRARISCLLAPRLDQFGLNYSSDVGGVRVPLFRSRLLTKRLSIVFSERPFDIPFRSG